MVARAGDKLCGPTKKDCTVNTMILFIFLSETVTKRKKIIRVGYAVSSCKYRIGV